MRRLIITIVCMLCMACCYGQHLSFMGVELGNKVSRFDKELKEKGFMRAFSHKIGDVYKNGSFAGYPAEVLLYMQQPSKKVKSAVAKIVGDYDLPQAVNIMGDLQQKILVKYPEATLTDTSAGGVLPHHTILLHNTYDESIKLLIDEDGKVNVIYVGDLTKRDPQDDI